MWWRPPRREVLSVVERGWRGARECSLALEGLEIPVTHLIKGSVSRQLLRMIRPAVHIRLVSVPRPIFRIRLWGMVVWRTIQGRLAWLLVDHERTLKELSGWCRAWGLTPVAIRETDQGYELWVGGQRQSLALVFQRHAGRAT